MLYHGISGHMLGLMRSDIILRVMGSSYDIPRAMRSNYDAPRVMHT